MDIQKIKKLKIDWLGKCPKCCSSQLTVETKMALKLGFMMAIKLLVIVAKQVKSTQMVSTHG